MECPYCEQELTYDDWYGTNMGYHRENNKLGDIYKCENESCEAFEEHFHTRNEELVQGYPC